MPKNTVEPGGGHKLRHNMAHTRRLLDMQGNMHARARTHTQMCNTYSFPQQVIVNER
jgi:hypothetical protein